MLYSCNCRIVWCAKHRRKVMVQGVDVRLKEVFGLLLRFQCRRSDVRGCSPSRVYTSRTTEVRCIMKRTVSLLMAVIGSTALVGCSSNAGPEPETIVQQYIAACQKSYRTTADTLWVENPEGCVNLDFVDDKVESAWLSQVTAENFHAEIKGDQATVAFKVTAPDVDVISATVMGDNWDTLYAAAMEGIAEEDEAKIAENDQLLYDMAQAMMVSALQANDAVMTTRDGTAALVKVDGTWKISTFDVPWDFE